MPADHKKAEHIWETLWAVCRSAWENFEEIKEFHRGRQFTVALTSWHVICTVLYRKMIQGRRVLLACSGTFANWCIELCQSIWTFQEIFTNKNALHFDSTGWAQFPYLFKGTVAWIRETKLGFLFRISFYLIWRFSPVYQFKYIYGQLSEEFLGL